MNRFFVVLCLVFILSLTAASSDTSTTVYLREGKTELVNLDGRVFPFKVEFIRGDLVGLVANNFNTVVFNIKKPQRIPLAGNLLIVELERIDKRNDGKYAFFRFDYKIINEPIPTTTHDMDFIDDTQATVVNLQLGEEKLLKIGPYVYKLFLEEVDIPFITIQLNQVNGANNMRDYFRNYDAKKYLFNGDLLWVRPIVIRKLNYGYESNIWIDSEKYNVIEVVEEEEVIDNGVRYDERIDELSLDAEENILLEKESISKSDANFDLNDYKQTNERN